MLFELYLFFHRMTVTSNLFLFLLFFAIALQHVSCALKVTARRFLNFGGDVAAFVTFPRPHHIPYRIREIINR